MKRNIRMLKQPAFKTSGINRVTEIISASLLLFATISSAFCVFQASQWNGQQSIELGIAGAYRTESVRASNNAFSVTLIDVDVFVNWIIAKSNNQTELADFLEIRFRDEFRPAFNAWIKMSENETKIPPGTPFELPEYKLEYLEESQKLTEEAEASFERALEANQISDRYIFTTVLFAMVLFLGTVGIQWTKLKEVRIVMIVFAGILFVYSIKLVLELPRILNI